MIETYPMCRKAGPAVSALAASLEWLSSIQLSCLGSEKNAHNAGLVRNHLKRVNHEPSLCGVITTDNLRLLYYDPSPLTPAKVIC